MSSKILRSAECIAIEKRGFIPNRYYVYVLIVEWSDGEKYPIYRKYSSFYDYERMLRERVGNNHNLPELPTMNVLQKAFKIEKNHVHEINDFCMGILRLPADIVSSHTVSAFFEIWLSDFPTEDHNDTDKVRKKDGKKKKPSLSDETLDCEKMALSDRQLPSAPYEDISAEYATLTEATSSLPGAINGNSTPHRSITPDDEPADIYVCTADYVPDSRDELSITEGMKCIVLERNDDGWWFIMREQDGHQGYAPGSFLAPDIPKKLHVVDNHYTEESLSDVKSPSKLGGGDAGMKVRVLSTYQATNGDEMSCKEGDELDVVSTDHTGWWTVRCNGKTGLVPAVHLQLTAHSARTSELFMRNNSLYARKPPPRLQRKAPDCGSTTSTKSSVNEHVSEWVKKEPPTVISESGYASIDELQESHMANRRIVPANNTNEKVQPVRTINYAELVFDEEAEKPKLTKPQTVPPASKKQDTIIYTQIIPKNLRPKPEETAPQAEDVSLSGKKPERGKAMKKQPLQPTTIKIEEPEKTQTGGRNTPSPPPVPPNCSTLDRESPLPIKPRQRPAEPQHNYENHSINPPASLTGSTQQNLSSHYMNVNKSSSPQPTTTVNNNTDPDQQNPVIIRRNREYRNHFLRRSSIEPPPPPALEAPKPIDGNNSEGSVESYSPMVSRVQSIASYNGPPISGMLMFTKGDIATVMSKCSHKGWWYVNLKGLEGYVPGAYWETYHSTSSPRSSPPTRRKPPQPVPRNRSPPTTGAPEKPATMEDEAWYHGKMSRPESEKLLSNFSNGVFLIRESVNRVGDLTLSVRWESKSRHFPIEAKDGGLYYIGKHDFKTLHGVITHYSKHALFYTEKNEPVKLKSPATKSKSS